MASKFVSPITYFPSLHQFSTLVRSSIQEVIIEPKILSRFGTLSFQETLEALEKCKENQLIPYLQWDILANERMIQQGAEFLESLPKEYIEGIRVEDRGIAQFIKEHYSQTKILLITETGNHNLSALQAWEAYFGNQLKRFILSTELPFSTIGNYCSQLQTPCEILGLGKILLFYSPRHLLSPVVEKRNSTDFFSAYAINEEHQPLYTIENQHGTFVFHHSDLFLLDLLPELSKIGLQYLRLDLRSQNTFSLLEEISFLFQRFDQESALQIKEDWPQKTIRGFYKFNRTNLPLKRLTNRHLQNRNEFFIGQVIESQKGEYIVLMTKKIFHLEDELLLITPDGKETSIVVRQIQNTRRENVQSANPPGIWILPYVKHSMTKTFVYFNQTSEEK